MRLTKPQTADMAGNVVSCVDDNGELFVIVKLLVWVGAVTEESPIDEVQGAGVLVRNVDHHATRLVRT